MSTRKTCPAADHILPQVISIKQPALVGGHQRRADLVPVADALGRHPVVDGNVLPVVSFLVEAVFNDLRRPVVEVIRLVSPLKVDVDFRRRQASRVIVDAPNERPTAGYHGNAPQHVPDVIEPDSNELFQIRPVQPVHGLQEVVGGAAKAERPQPMRETGC